MQIKQTTPLMAVLCGLGAMFIISIYLFIPTALIYLFIVKEINKGFFWVWGILTIIFSAIPPRKVTTNIVVPINKS